MGFRLRDIGLLRREGDLVRLLKNWRFWAGSGVSLLFLALMAVSVPLERLWGVLAAADCRYVLLAAAVYFFSLALRAMRWSGVLAPLGVFPWRRLYPLLVMGQAGNNVLPARLGDLFRVWQLARREGVGSGAGLASLGVERIFDGGALLLLSCGAAGVLLLAGAFAGDSALLRSALLALLALAGLGTLLSLGLLLLLAWSGSAARFFSFLEEYVPGRWRPAAARFLESFQGGLLVLRRPRLLGRLVLSSGGVWLGEGAVYLIVAWSFGLADYFGGLGLFLAAVLLVTGVSNLAGAFPFSIGGIGPFELAAQGVLAALGVPLAVGLAYGLTTHLAALWLPVNLVGLGLLLRGGGPPGNWGRDFGVGGGKGEEKGVELPGEGKAPGAGGC